MRVRKILESSTGESEEFFSSDNAVSYKLVIDGSANSDVHAYYIDKQLDINGFYLKIRCSDYGNAVINLLCKLNKFTDDEFTKTGDSFSKDSLNVFYYT